MQIAIHNEEDQIENKEVIALLDKCEM